MKTNLIISFIILVANSAYSQTRVIAFEQELFNEFPNVRDIAISPNGNEIYSLQAEKNSASFFESGHQLSGLRSTERAVFVSSQVIFSALY